MRGDIPPGTPEREETAAPVPRADHAPRPDPDVRRFDEPSREGIDLARELTGDLPCAGCGYNLRSLSIRGVCPECGTPVRATILARIDPFAGVLRPITCPVPTAAGVVVWSMFALMAAVLTWYLRGADALGAVMNRSTPTQLAAVVGATLCIVISAAGALALVRPHAGISVRRQLLAVGGVAAMLALAWVHWRLHGRFDPRHIDPYFGSGTDGFTPQRNVLRLISAGLIIAAILALRPNFRLLASRSLLMRMGRVDRQTLPVLALVAGVAALGDLLQLLAAAIAPTGSTLMTALQTAWIFLIGVGSMLLTIGIGGLVVDCLRLVPVILRPPISMSQVLGPENPASPGPEGARR